MPSVVENYVNRLSTVENANINRRAINLVTEEQASRIKEIEDFYGIQLVEMKIYSNEANE